MYIPRVAAGDVVLIGVFIFGFALISRRSRSWPLTMPMVFVALGALMSGTGLLEVETELGSVAVLAEVALAVILFSDAVRIDLRAMRRNALVPTRLLLIGLPLTIVLGTVFNIALFPDVPFAEVALLAAILAPTDAALGAAVIEDESVPLRERLSLNVESGLNDGLVVPVVAILTTVALTGGTTGPDAVRTIAEELGFGLLVGVVAGLVSIVALSRARARGWSDGRYEQIAVFIIPLAALAGATVLDGSGFIAAFVAGLIFGSVGGSGFTVPFFARLAKTEPGEKALAEKLDEFTEDAAQLLGILAFFVFGNLFVGEALGRFQPAVWVCALLSLTVVRILPVWISQIGTGRPWQTRLFLGWFGPRGLASIVFGILLIEDAAEFGADFGEILGVITLTVTASVVLHGASAAWGARRYGAWAQGADLEEEQRSEMYMEDMDPEVVPPARWSLR